jgi:GT2 family glycosyltransferase
MIKLSIIITHYNTPELLDLCIKSIKDTVKNLKYEIIVVDVESKEKNREFINGKYPDIKLISFKRNIGYSKTVNAGIREAIGDYVLILNADIITLDNAVTEMIKFLDKHKEVGIIGPQLLDFTNNIQASCFANPDLKAIIARRTFLGRTRWGKRVLDEFTIGDWDRNSLRRVDWVQGSAMMMKREAIDKVGLWDERFFMYFEDADWCRRFWQNGFEVVYLPSAKMFHYYHRSSKKSGVIIDIILNKYTRMHILSALKYFKKYGF